MYNTVVQKVSHLHQKYAQHAEKVLVRSTLQYKDYGIKLTMSVMDQNPQPVDVVNLTIWLLFTDMLPLLEKFVESVDFAIANILDLYDPRNRK